MRTRTRVCLLALCAALLTGCGGPTEGGYEELAVLRMADAEAAAAALEAVQAHVSDRRESEAETQYKPEDLPKLEKALTEQAGNTVLLVVCADYDAAQKALDALGS